MPRLARFAAPETYSGTDAPSPVVHVPGVNLPDTAQLAPEISFSSALLHDVPRK